MVYNKSKSKLKSHARDESIVHVKFHIRSGTYVSTFKIELLWFVLFHTQSHIKFPESVVKPLF